jgi:CheY-like chemotaxis protein
LSFSIVYLMEFSENDPMLKRNNILIVEDDEAVRLMMQDVLELNGYAVFTASDGGEGIKILRELLPNSCMVLLDLMMPRTNGWQFLDVQRNDPEMSAVPVVVCSAYRESAKSIYPAAFIEKPIQLDVLLGTVQRFCV